MKYLIIVAAILALGSCQFRPFRPFPNNHKAVFIAGNDNSGVYRGSSDGAYKPDNSGAYRNDDGQYHPDNSGQYVHSDDKYKHQGDAYKHQGDKFANGGAYNGANGGNGGNGNYQNVGSGSGSGSGSASGSSFGAGAGFGSGSTILTAGEVYGTTKRPGKNPEPTARPGKRPVGVFTGTLGGNGNVGNQYGQGNQGNQGNKYGNQGNQAFASGDKYDNRNYRILRQEGKVEQDGYHYLYETENGIEAEEQGKLANVGTDEEGMRAHGFYTYTGPDNVVYTVRYTADENGFQPEGAHIPAIPAAIQRALEYQRSKGTL